MLSQVCYPTRIWIVRGNHEFKWMNEAMGKRSQFEDFLRQRKGPIDLYLIYFVPTGVCGFKNQCEQYFPPPPPRPRGTVKHQGPKEERAPIVPSYLVRGGVVDPLDEAIDSLAEPNGEDAMGKEKEEAESAVKLPSPFFTLAHMVFSWLPVAALVGPSGAPEPVLVLHGGVGDGSWSLKDLEATMLAARPMEDETILPVCVSQVWTRGTILRPWP